MNLFNKFKESIGNKDGIFSLRAKSKMFPRKTAVNLLLLSLKKKYAFISYFWDELQRKELEYMRERFHIHPFSMPIVEGYQIYKLAQSTKKVLGEIAEVGVYRGGTARLICQAKETGRELHLFDTFRGLPEVHEKDEGVFLTGSFKISDDEFESIKEAFKEEKNVYFHRGFFPETSGPVKDKLFSFVHLDADIYESTMNCLEFFYPRMSKGGVILSHDYHGAPGVRKAFEEFFADKAEPVIVLSTSQCLIVKA